MVQKPAIGVDIKMTGERQLTLTDFDLMGDDLHNRIEAEKHPCLKKYHQGAIGYIGSLKQKMKREGENIG